MAAPCTCPNGQHDGRFPYCSGASGEPIVIDHLPAPGPATVSCDAVPMPIVPDPRDARIAELEAEVATATKAWEEAELLVDRWRDFVKRERAKYDFRGKGGQQCGDMSPKINLSALIEMERELRHFPENVRYTMEEFVKIREQMDAALREVVRLEALIVSAPSHFPAEADRIRSRAQ